MRPFGSMHAVAVVAVLCTGAVVLMPAPAAAQKFLKINQPDLYRKRKPPAVPPAPPASRPANESAPVARPATAAAPPPEPLVCIAGCGAKR